MPKIDVDIYPTVAWENVKILSSVTEGRITDFEAEYKEEIRHIRIGTHYRHLVDVINQNVGERLTLDIFPYTWTIGSRSGTIPCLMSVKE